MTLKKPTKLEVYHTVKDYFFITIGLISYAAAWATFLLPYQITTGGTTGIGAIIYYATGFPIQSTYFIVNAVLMMFAFKLLGLKFCIKTSYSILLLTFLLWFFQKIVNGDDGIPPHILGEGQEFMACIIGSVMCGFGLGIVFNVNVIQLCDVIIISSCYFVFHDLRRVIFGFVTLFIIGYVLDYVVNSARQSVQFFIFSKEYDKIADVINKKTHRGVTVFDGTGWYSKHNVKVLFVLASKRQSVEIFRLVKSIDSNAFISQSAVIGVFGEGFDKLKVKVNKKDEKAIEEVLVSQKA